MSGKRNNPKRRKPKLTAREKSRLQFGPKTKPKRERDARIRWQLKKEPWMANIMSHFWRKQGDLLLQQLKKLKECYLWRDLVLFGPAYAALINIRKVVYEREKQLAITMQVYGNVCPAVGKSEACGLFEKAAVASADCFKKNKLWAKFHKSADIVATGKANGTCGLPRPWKIVKELDPFMGLIAISDAIERGDWCELLCCDFNIVDTRLENWMQTFKKLLGRTCFRRVIVSTPRGIKDLDALRKAGLVGLELRFSKPLEQSPFTTLGNQPNKIKKWKPAPKESLIDSAHKECNNVEHVLFPALNAGVGGKIKMPLEREQNVFVGRVCGKIERHDSGSLSV